MCDDSGVDILTTSEFSDPQDGHSIQSEDPVASLDELDSGEEAPSGFFHATPYHIYSVDSGTDFSVDGDADASISQFLHDHCINQSEPRFLPELSLFHTYPRNLDELFEVPSFRPHSPGADSLLANPSEGEHSLMSSMTSSIQLSKHGVDPAYFTIGAGSCFEHAKNYFLGRPLELTESLQHKHHCGHGVVCCGSSPAREMVVEDADSE